MWRNDFTNNENQISLDACATIVANDDVQYDYNHHAEWGSTPSVFGNNGNGPDLNGTRDQCNVSNNIEIINGGGMV